jgi:hypothetical protein
MSATNYLENAVLDHLVGNSVLTGGVIYIALATNGSTPDPETGAFTEVSETGTGYVRQQAAAGDWATSSGGTVTTSGNIQFPVATAAYGTVTHVVLTDSASYGGGNVWLIQALTTQKTVDQDDQFVINNSNLSISLD